MSVRKTRSLPAAADRDATELKAFSEGLAVSHSDEQLISAFVRHRDENAFRALVERHTITIRKILFAVLNGNTEEIREVEQEVLIALYRSLPDFRFRSSFSTWLYRFCRNKAVDFLRRTSVRKRRELRLRQLLELKVPSDNPYDPEHRILKEETRERVRHVLQRLSERDREILVLKDMDDNRLEEISGLLNIPVGTVKSRLYRARRKAARLMEESV